ncbi:type I 3-dehydroquinate dehydratase [Ramlibacter humi]|uniref:3-dehydroquinate dehydratase n=2 Tax=Ramlibacter humi TaxID=2530451 RepID=A0A4Z0BZR9_9BURK|nr:type I 3-dehydroquinate dehydratase [Ramlibacter humi]
MPAVCVPFVGRTAGALRAEAARAARLKPDLVEWRVDFFEGIARTADVVALAQELRNAAGVPLLFTRRSSREGGQPIALGEPEVVALYEAVCAARAADIVDAEMAGDRAHVQAVREAARAAGIALLLSFHDFAGTPPAGELLARFRQAQDLGADIGKLAVMPQSKADVLALLQATLQASETLDIPVAGMAMGALGAASRLCGGEFGSALTFGMGEAASAPGQMPVDALRAGLAVLREASARR